MDRRLHWGNASAGPEVPLRRPNALDRLATRYACDSPWESMAVDGDGRFCAGCSRHVFDLERMSPGEIARHLAASRGSFCARVVRRQGHVVTGPATASGAPAWEAPRRTSSVVAGLVSAWLAASPGSAATPAESRGAATGASEPGEALPRARAAAPEPATATISGRAVDEQGFALPGNQILVRSRVDGEHRQGLTAPDGTFVVPGLAAGVYDVEAFLEGFVFASRAATLAAGTTASFELLGTVDDSMYVTVGAMVVGPSPLHAVLHEADLVVAAVVGGSKVVSGDDGWVRVATRLRPTRVFYGGTAERELVWYHEEYEDAELGPAWREDLAPGSTVLAFLVRGEADAGTGRRSGWEGADYGFGVRRLAADELAVYSERVEELLEIERTAFREGSGNPEALAEWLVKMAEDRRTRLDATSSIAEALGALDAVADEARVPRAAVARDLRALVADARREGVQLPLEPDAAVIGAFLGDDRGARLAEALLAEERFAIEDRALFGVVLPERPQVALSWLDGRLRATAPDADAPLVWWLGKVADELGDPDLEAIAEIAAEREQAIALMWPEDLSQAATEKRRDALLELDRSLRHEVAARLAVLLTAADRKDR
jgi:hypothetical protein